MAEIYSIPDNNSGTPQFTIPFGSEDGAWLTGFLMRQAVRLLGEPCK